MVFCAAECRDFWNVCIGIFRNVAAIRLIFPTSDQHRSATLNSRDKTPIDVSVKTGSLTAQFQVRVPVTDGSTVQYLELHFRRDATGVSR
jgi:hypothetical protein